MEAANTPSRKRNSQFSDSPAPMSKSASASAKTPNIDTSNGRVATGAVSAATPKTIATMPRIPTIHHRRINRLNITLLLLDLLRTRASGLPNEGRDIVHVDRLADDAARAQGERLLRDLRRA